MTYVIISSLIIVYFSLGFATYKKFEENGIKLKKRGKILMYFLPIIIFSLHTILAIKTVSENKTLALEIFKLGSIKYPIAIGILIEVTLEKFAQKVVFGEIALKSVNRKTKVVLDSELITERKAFLSLYKKTVDLAYC